MPGKWLVWHAGGLLGPRRYACPDHRKALLKNIRFHYAYCGEQWVWKRPPYPQRWPPDGIAADPDAPADDPRLVRARSRRDGRARRRGSRRASALSASGRPGARPAGVLLGAARVLVLDPVAPAHLGDGVASAARAAGTS